MKLKKMLNKSVYVFSDKGGRTINLILTRPHSDILTVVWYGMDIWQFIKEAFECHVEVQIISDADLANCDLDKWSDKI